MLLFKSVTVVVLLKWLDSLKNHGQTNIQISKKVERETKELAGTFTSSFSSEETPGDWKVANITKLF